MSALYRKIVATAALVIGTVWVIPTHDDGAIAGTAVEPVKPEFEIRVRRSNITITGHTISSAHENALRRAVAESFPTLEKTFEFRPNGLVPGWWGSTTAELIPVLGTMTAPAARLADGELRVSAVVNDEDSARAWLRALDLPDEVKLRTRLTAVSDEKPAMALCQRQFSQLDISPVQFEESNTIMRDSAYPVLDRIALLADACRSSVITITGHTDSSGNPDWNLQLSRKRAEVVAAYLAERGVDPARLTAIGAGSAEPVADNATRYGRSLNRRIDIAFSGSN